MISLVDELAGYAPTTRQEVIDLARARKLLAGGDAWSRMLPLHVTGSAVVVDPVGGRVLLRWHDRLQSWLQVGGHADPGETHAFVTALREAGEETGLDDLRPWPGPDRKIVHVVAVPVPAGRDEAAHEHLDVRYVLATDRPEAVSPETPAAPLRWLPAEDAIAFAGEDNLRIMLRRVADLLAAS